MNILLASLALLLFSSSVMANEIYIYNDTNYCTSKNSPFAFKYTYTYNGYAKNPHDGIIVLEKTTKNSNYYKYFGTQRASVKVIFKLVGENILNLPTLLFNTSNRWSLGFIDSIDEVGNIFEKVSYRIDYNLSSTYKVFENCGQVDLNN